ncbi:type VI secretion system Vgr family protein, partial [Acinetobacter baumannii]|nr:type VI secretion system Vgr family protein [Acinetobacter baumannii]
DQKGQLPDTKKLSGIRSEEVDGKGFNQLRFDDTTGQISAQLQSSHAVSQLNLGNLSHPKDKAESDGRGEGFELRTDQWGAVRAGKGLLVSTHKQDQAQGTHLDAADAKQQIEGGLNNAKALSEVAKNQQTDPLEMLENLKTFIEQIEEKDQDKAAIFKQALMVLTAPNSIAVASNEDIHLSADGQLSQNAGDSISLSTQKNLIAHAQNKISLFAAQQGARLYAGKGKVEIQAQGDGADLIARKGIQIISTEDKIEINASKEIVITSGSSQIKINSSGIFPVTGGKFEVKAGQHVFMGGGSASSTLPALPQLNIPPKELELKYVYDDLKPVAQAPYKLIFQDGSMQEGILDSNGYAKVQVPADKVQPKVYYGFSNMEAKPDQPKQQNSFKDKKVMSIVEAEQLIEQYNKQELDHLLDEYFPDEIQAMIDGQGVEYDDHINDYVEKDLEQQNNPDDAIADQAEEIPLNKQSTPHSGFGEGI